MKPLRRRIAKDLHEKLLLLFAGILLYLLIDCWSQVWALTSWVLNILTPFFVGIGLAYLLDIPVRALESHGVKKRGVAVLISMVLVLGLLVLLITQMVPSLVESVQLLLKNLPYYYDSATAVVRRISIKMGLPDNSILLEMARYREQITDVSRLILSAVWEITSHIELLIGYSRAVGNGIVQAFTSIAFAVYMLLDKQKLLVQARKLAWCFLSRRQVRKLFNLCEVANSMCKGFFEGKCIDSMVMGVLTLIVMSLLGLPFVGLISLVVAITNIVPIVGPIVGAVVGFLLVVLENTAQGYEFLIMILVLQQLDGKVIGPHILGDRVGLPTMWVLAALMVGGAVGGALGMVLGVPLLATVFALVRELMNRNTNVYHASRIAVRLVDEPDEPEPASEPAREEIK